MRDPGESISFLMHDVSRLIRRNFSHRARELGLTQQQCKALAYAARYEGLNQAQLAEYMEIQPITAARLIDKLEHENLVERRPDPSDRRAILLYVREAATPLLEKIWDFVAETRTEALAGLPEETRGIMIDALQHMRQNLISRSGPSDVLPSCKPGDEKSREAVHE